MTDSSDIEGIKSAIPIAFGTSELRCFGWFHAAHTPVREVGVVLCRPVGYEGTCAYETYTQLAEQLASAGFAVVRFDYHGTGDSAGSDTDPDRVRAWINSTIAATHEVMRLGSVARIVMFGVRLGATLAAQVASELGGVESLVMWAPCVTGRAFARELRASQSNSPSTAADAAQGDIEALGYTYTAQTLQDLNTLDCQNVDAPPAKRVMVIGRDDMPVEGPLPTKYKAMGIETTYAVLSGYSGMIVEPHEGVVALDTLDSIVAWLSTAHPLRTEASGATQDTATTNPSIQEASVFNGVRETPLTFGPEQNLFGILSESAELPVADRRSETAVLMLTVGSNHRIGPNRLYVKLARSWAAHGYRALRFDLAGTGDSRSAAGAYSSHRLYSKGSTVDVQSAIDSLVAKGCKKFVVMGLCSGAYVAFQTALADPRVSGQILMNPRRLEWKEGETLRSAMQNMYKTTHFYRRALWDIDVYRRLLRGEVDVQGIAGRIRVLVQARIKRAFDRLMRRPPSEEDVLANVKRLSARNTNTLMVIGSEDDGRDYIELHLGNRGSRMRNDPNFRMTLVEGSDHTFSTAGSQQFVANAVMEQLDKWVLNDAQHMRPLN
jgi:alpha-beta hydrolase superfamily lysophospholipase